MGIGHLGFKNLVFKRKFRWTFEVVELCGNQNIPAHYVKVASRPNLTIDETEINYLNAKTWIPGKASWETITVTYIDVATQDLKPLYDWLASVYNFSNPITLEMGSRRGDYNGVGILYLYDGCGMPLEKWVLQDMWPQAVNWGDLDYAASDEVTVELTLRYSQVYYESLCPPYKPQNCCSPCGGNPYQENTNPSSYNTLGQLG